MFKNALLCLIFKMFITHTCKYKYKTNFHISFLQGKKSILYAIKVLISWILKKEFLSVNYLNDANSE